VEMARLLRIAYGIERKVQEKQKGPAGLGGGRSEKVRQKARWGGRSFQLEHLQRTKKKTYLFSTRGDWTRKGRSSCLKYKLGRGSEGGVGAADRSEGKEARHDSFLHVSLWSSRYITRATSDCYNHRPKCEPCLGVNPRRGKEEN